MSTYTVTDACARLRLAALRDSLGRRHVVHLAAEIPEIGVQLEGPSLKPRLATLLVAATGHVFAISVEAMECSGLYVLERLHPVAVIDEPARGPSPIAKASPTSVAPRALNA